MNEDEARRLLAFFGGPLPAAPPTSAAAAPVTNADGSAVPPAPGVADGAPSTTVAPPTSAPMGVVPDQEAACG